MSVTVSSIPICVPSRPVVLCTNFILTVRVIYNMSAETSATLVQSGKMEHQPTHEDWVRYLLSINTYTGGKALTKDFLSDFVPLIRKTKDFTVTLADVALCLHSNLRTLTRALRRDFQQGADYVMVPSTKQRPQEEILLSSPYFKSLCMRSRSPRGEQARSYFLLTEKIYRDNWKEGGH